MGIIADMMRKEENAGYSGANLTAKVSQDIVLEAMLIRIRISPKKNMGHVAYDRKDDKNVFSMIKKYS